MRVLIITDLKETLMPEEADFLRKAEADACFLLGNIEKGVLLQIKDLLPVMPTYGILGDEDELDALDSAGIRNIHGEVLKIKGVSFLGVSGGAGYQSNKAHAIFTQAQMSVFMSHQQKVDVLIAHEGPHNLYSYKPGRCGFLGISNYINRHNPKYLIHGHQQIRSKKTVGYGEKTRVIGAYGVELHHLTL